MTKRQIYIIAGGVVFLIGSILISRNLNKDKGQKPVAAEMITAVQSEKFTPGEVFRYIPVTGRLIPAKSVHLFAEVGGVASMGSKPFKEGTRYKKGELILRVNSDEIQSSLIAGRSSFQSLLASAIPDIKIDFSDDAAKWEDYLYQMEIDQTLPPLPEVKDRKLKLFLSGRQIFANYYSVKELETRYEKYNIRAPFDGSLVETNLDESSLVRVGQPLGEFISTDVYELEHAISYSDIPFMQTGTVYPVMDVNTHHEYRAEVIRINDRVDPNTQQVKVFSRIRDKAAKSGIYLRGKVPASKFANAIRLPLSAMVGDSSIFTIKDSLAILTPVNVLYKNEESAIISGISDKIEIVLGDYNESLNGTKVATVNISK